LHALTPFAGGRGCPERIWYQNNPPAGESHDPTKVSGKTLAKKWVDLFNATRDRFLNEISDIPIANKAYRLRVLQRMATTPKA
jgi:hypothetical protein